MGTRFVVTGGTGALGRVVVGQLAGTGRDVVVLSRRPAPPGRAGGIGWLTADLRTGAGLAGALREGDVVVHCATQNSGRKDVQAARVLVEAARGAGCAHLVSVSIVGVDRVPLPYYRGKLAAEHVVEDGGVPHSVLRATQFHDLLRVVLANAAALPVMPVPDLRFQPVDVHDVAAALVGLALGGPVGRAPDVGGPQVRDLTDLARAWLAATGRRRRVVPVRLPGAVFRAYREGGHLVPERAVGRVTFEEHLAAHPDPASRRYRLDPPGSVG